MVESVEPMWGNLCIKLDPREEKTAGGLIIPEPARQKVLRGTVMSVGPGRVTDDGKQHKPELQPGDRVELGRDFGFTVTVDDEDYMIIPEIIRGCHLALAVFEETEELADLVENVGIDNEYLSVDIPNWKSADNLGVVQLYQSEGWIPFKVVQGTDTLRYFYRPLQWHRDKWAEIEQMGKALNAPVFEGAAMVGLEPLESVNPFAPDPIVVAPEQYIQEPLDPELWEIRVLNLMCYNAEHPRSPEWQQLRKYEREGWEVHECDSNKESLLVTSMKRKKVL